MKQLSAIDYTRLYQLYAEEMYAYGMAFKMDKESVLDAIHDVFLRIIERENLLDINRNARFYLLVSLRNRLFSMKRDNALLESMDDNENFNFTIAVSGLEDVTQEDERNEIINRIETILGELTGKQREVIYLRYMQNFSYEEIAEILHISIKAVRKLNYRAICRIRELYGAPFFIFLQWISVGIERS